MSNELFHNSKVGVNTCIMLFRTKERHLENFKTYFAYWKEDGFYKKKLVEELIMIMFGQK